MGFFYGIGIKKKWQVKGMCQLQSFKQGNQKRLIPKLGQFKQLKDALPKLPICALIDMPKIRSCGLH